MSTDIVFFGWNRPIPGRGRMSADRFQEFVGYLASRHLQGAGVVRGVTGELLAEQMDHWTGLVPES